MNKLNSILFLAVILVLSACEKEGTTPDKDSSDGYWSEAEPLIVSGTSSTYPYGIVARKHSNSISVNTNPPFSTITTSEIGNADLENGVQMVQRSEFANPETYQKKIYFDSNAEEGGNGSIESPYNSMKGLTNGGLLADSTAYLFKAGSVFMSSGIQLDYNRSGTMVYFGSYGEGDMPIICNANNYDNPTELNGSFWFYGNQIAINGLHLVRCTNSDYAVMLNLSGSNVTIANSHIESIRNSDGRFPYYCIKGGADNLTIYNTEIAYSSNDLFYLSGDNTYTFVSNYFHHNNMGTFAADTVDPQNRDTWRYSTGDIIQFEYGTPKSSYFANNVFDRGSSSSKFCFIINGATPLEETDGTSIEYNTFINPLSSQYGGAGCYIYSHVLLKDNLFINTDTEGVVSGLAIGSGYASEATNNHFVNFNGSETYGVSWGQLGEGNLMFDNLATYHSEVPLQDRKGSSLF